MKCSIRALIFLSVAIAVVHSYGPPRPRPMRRSPPHRHMIVSRRDPAYLPGPPYTKRPMSNMMISHPGSRPKKHISSLSGHYTKYSPVYKYPPPPHSRPFSAGPPKKSYYPRPYGPPGKYPYYGKHPGYMTKSRPKIPYEPDIPKETIATFVNTPSSNYGQGTPTLNYKGNAKVPTITYGSPSIASKPYSLYGSSEEDNGSGSSEEIVQGSHHVSASIKYGKNTPGAGPAHPSLLDPATNIKYPGPSFKFPPNTAQPSNRYQTINPTQATKYDKENSQVKYPSADGSESSNYRRRRPQRQDASKATQAVTSKPYSTSNVKFPAANSDGGASSYQNYDHFLQETFAPDLGGGAATHQTHQTENTGSTRQKKKDRTKSRYRTPSPQHYEVRDEPEERGDTYDDIETVDSDYEGWQPSDTK